MSLKHRTILSFLATVLVWLVFAWPLPRFAARGIPSSAHNIELNSARRMIVGDHLQLHYFYWLFSDMLAGNTPLFENRYEFNTGTDADRYKPGAYNLPLSLIYAAVRPLSTRAFAWNSVLFLSLWLTVLWTWLALRGLIRSDRLTLLAAIAAIAFPYRWVMLLGGSPTGTATLWLALLTFGLSLAFREDKPAGGVYAALALTGAYFNDRHVFFFSYLATPFLILLFLLLRNEIPWKSPAFRRSCLLAAIPLAAAMLILGGLAARTALDGFSNTSLAGGRTLEEVRKYAPNVPGLVNRGGRGSNAHTYLGWAFFAFTALSLTSLLRGWTARTPRERRLALAGILLWLASFGVILLALGPNGPFDGALFDFFRDHVPGSKAMRQPAKIFALFTPILPLAIIVTFADLFRTRSLNPGNLPSILISLRPGVILAFVMLVDFSTQINASICLLDYSQPAYAAVASDAAARKIVPRAVILPLWPGDSDWAAVYQHYVSLYRIRMLNGYRPVVPNDYRDLVRQFTSLNGGLMDDAQADALLGRGFGYIILHEDAFPEKVSPFPVIYTRNRLLAHPRLELLRHAETVWSFKILPTPRNWVPTLRPGPLFPTRLWEFERAPGAQVAVRPDPDACHEAYAAISGPGSVSPRGFKTTGVPDPALLLRLRGDGELWMAPTSNEPPVLAAVVRTNAWTWFRFALDPERTTEVYPVFTVPTGSVDADFALLHSGTWNPPAPGRPVTIPAEFFFHAGWSDPITGTVHFRPDYEPNDFIFYGPRLPMGPGRIRIDLDIATDAAPGTKLGRVTVENTGLPLEPLDVTAGEPFRCEVTLTSNRPVSLNFQYRRRAPVAIRSATFTALPD
jgi:hypothetical protein